MANTIEKNSENEVMFDRSIIENTVGALLYKGDGKNVNDYREMLDRIIDNEISKKKLTLKEWHADSEKEWKNEFYILLIEKFNEEITRHDNKRKDEEKTIRWCKNHKDNLKILGREQELPLVRGQKEQKIETKKAKIDERKDFTEETKEEIYVGEKEPTLEEIKLSVESMQNFMDSWENGKNSKTFYQDMADGFKMDYEKNDIKRILMAQISAFYNLNLKNADETTRARVENLQESMKGKEILSAIDSAKI